jgi:hypothetical protein
MGVGKTRPSWHCKEIGAKLVAWAIERFGDEFYTRLADKMGLEEGDMDSIMKEVESYYDRALFRCTHLLEVTDMNDFEAVLEKGTFDAWSESAKEVRKKKA